MTWSINCVKCCYLSYSRQCRNIVTIVNKARYSSLGSTHFSTSSIAAAIKKKGKTPASQRWIERQNRDHYVKQAAVDHFRCRSAYKLIEIDDKYRILSAGDVVIDCGAAPGSWTQVAVQRVNAVNASSNGNIGKVISIDLQRMSPVQGAMMLSGDFTSAQMQEEVRNLLDGQSVDSVISDMAPKATGVKSLDHDLIMNLSFSALTFSVGVLKDGGHFLCKIWNGAELSRLETVMGKLFQTVKVIKPPSSRSESAEVFILGKGFDKKVVKHKTM